MSFNPAFCDYLRLVNGARLRDMLEMANRWLVIDRGGTLKEFATAIYGKWNEKQLMESEDYDEMFWRRPERNGFKYEREINVCLFLFFIALV